MFDHIESKEHQAADARKALGLPVPNGAGALGSMFGVRVCADRPWSEYPIGTKAHAIMGGWWTRVPDGWKWCSGSTFPTPGGDAVGACVELPND